MINIHAFDTETPLSQIRVVADENEVREVKTFKDIVGFLFRYRESVSNYFMFNLRFDAQAILKTIAKSKWIEMWNGDTVTQDGYKISYLSGVSLVIRKGKQKVNFFDIAKFYQGYSLNNAAEEFLGEKKDDRVDSAKLGTSKQYYLDNIELVKEYCLKDAQLTYGLVRVMEKQILELKMSFDSPFSAATIGRNHQLSRNSPLYPKVPRSVKWMEEVAEEAFHGGMFQTLQRGYFEEELFDYDINSAYPSTMAALPNWANGRFITVEPDDLNDGHTHGWYLCDFDCEWIPYDSKIPWTFADIIKGVECISTANNNRIYYATGMRRGVVTKIEFDFMVKHGFKVTFLGGIGWYPDPEKLQYPNPFNWVADLYNKRKLIKKTNNALQYAMKIIMNGTYGSTIQRVGRAQIKNWFYGSYITADTRVKLAEVAVRNPKRVINIATDGIVLTRKQKSLPVSKELGEWELNEYSKGLFIGSGMYQLWDKEGNFKTKARGITNQRNWDIYQALVDHPMDSKLEFKKNRPIQMGEIIAHHKILRSRDLNAFKDVIKRLNVNTDSMHRWEPEYKVFKDLLENISYGIPYTIEYINRKDKKQSRLDEF